MADVYAVRIVDFEPQYKKAFRDLSEEWISKHFKMVEEDFKVLDHPQEYIIDNGGYVAFAIVDGVPVGTYALIKTDEACFELVKLGVSPSAHGKGIGKLLCQHAISKAKELGATRFFLESNRSLTPAIALYHKMGFQEIQNFVSIYERVDIAMEMMF